MAHIALTGARGFVGWHTRAAAIVSATDSTAVAVGDAFDQATATAAIDGSYRLLHIAGVNRGTDDEVRDGNVLFATQVASALRACDNPPAIVVFANSTQVGNGSLYGEAKEAAAEIVAAAAVDVGAEFVDVRLPNVFGEHGRPFYNSVVSTFCHLVSTGGAPTIDVDRELTLIHAQDAADVLLGSVQLDRAPLSRSTVTGLLHDIQRIAAATSRGEFTPITTEHERNLVSTYRSFAFAHQPYSTVPGAAESARATGTTFRRRQLERLAAVRGSATVRLSRPFTDDVIELRVQGGDAVDLPALWSAEISGTNDLELAAWTTGPVE